MLAHRVFTEPPSHHPDRGYDKVEDYTQNNSRVDPTQDMPNRHPALVNPKQAFWKDGGGNEQASRDRHGPPSGIFVAENNWPKTYDSEDAADGQAKRAQLLACDLV